MSGEPLYQFTRAVTVEGAQFAADQVVAASQLPPGSLQACLGVGYLRPVADEPIDEPAQPAKPAKRPK